MIRYAEFLAAGKRNIHLSSKTPLKDYIVIDVRDDDYRGGNIKGARNSPSALFHANVDELVKSTKDVPTVVFHCMLSQQRGPKAAQVKSRHGDVVHSS